MLEALSKHQWRVAGSAALVCIVWLAMTRIFWIGYVGADDIFYARYAFLFHRPPINQWEFRIPAILAIRASFLLFGPTAFAAAVPSLLASLAILASVAWFVGWPAKLTWQTQAAMILAATMPLDVDYRSVPGAPYLAAGFLAMGSVLLLKAKARIQAVGALLLTLGFFTHEVAVCYVAILCLTAVVFDRNRYWRPVLTVVALSGLTVVLEGVVYYFLVGDFFARYRLTSTVASTLPAIYDLDTGLGGIRFFLWPLQNLLFGKSFGCDLLLLVVAGILSFRHLSKEQIILLTATCLTLGWLGYGTLLPWTYRPVWRQSHFYAPLLLGVAALLPTVWAYGDTNKKWIAPGIISMAVAIHFACLATGGRWGQEVVVSQKLLQYANQHEDRMFVTDVRTMNYMYAVAGFRLPKNVVCLNGPAVEQHLRVNKEPPGTPRFRFSNPPIDAVLVNNQMVQTGKAETEFVRFLKEHGERRIFVVPARYKPVFVPFFSLIGRREFFIKSLGGEVLQVRSAPWRPM